MENKIRLSQMKTADTTHGNFCKRDQALFQYCGSGANYEHRCQVLLTSIMGTLLWNMKEKVMFACYQTCIKVETIHGMRFPEGTVAAFSIPGRHHKSYTDVILATEAASTSSFLLLMVIHQATSNWYLAFFCSGMIQTIFTQSAVESAKVTCAWSGKKDIHTTLRCPMYIWLTEESFMGISEQYSHRVQCREPGCLTCTFQLLLLALVMWPYVVITWHLNVMP